MNEDMEPIVALRFDAAVNEAFDERDVNAIRAGGPNMGSGADDFRNDANVIFFARQLDFVRARIYEKKYPSMKGSLLVPVRSDTPDWAETITTRMYDQVGMAKIISNYADDLPRQDVRAVESSTRVRDVGAAYGYSINDIRASRAAGTGLPQQRATVARRSVEEKLNRIVLRGDPDYRLFGLLTHPNLPQVVLPNGNWSAAGTTGDQILEDLDYLWQALQDQSLGMHTPNTLAMSPSAHAAATNKRLADSNGAVAMQWFLAKHPGLTVLEVYEAKNAGPTNKDIILLYERSEENLGHDLVSPFEQLPVQARNLEFVVNCLARTGGVQIEYPLAFAMAEGV